MKKEAQRVIIRKAEVGDAQTIRKLEEKVWNEEVANKYDSPMFIRFGYVFVAQVGTKIIGAIVSYRTNKNEVYVCDLVVDEKYRRLKIGEKLYKKLLTAVRGMSVVSFLDPDLDPTAKLHEKLGGKVVTKIKDPYDLAHDGGLETGVRLFVRIHNK